VEGALAGQGLAAVGRVAAALAGGVGLADEDGEQGVVAEGVVVEEVLVPQAQAEDALLEEVGEGVLDAVGVAVVGEAAGEALDEAELGLDLAEEQAAGVGGDVAAVEGGGHLAAAEGLKKEFGVGTLCRHEAVLSVWRKGSRSTPLCHKGQPRAIPSVRNPG